MTSEEAYRKAEEKIKKALESRETRLDLSKMELVELPESLGQLRYLERLYLSDNRLTLLPESLGQLTRLERLHLGNNNLESLPESLSQLTQLDRLYISNNKLAWLPESIGRLIELKKLYIDKNCLEELPESLGQLTELQFLYVNGNLLKSLPESLRHLTQMECIDASYNQLVSLPESLGKLPLLQRLDLTNNRLTELPESLGQLTRLQELYLSDNQLASLPESLGQLTKMRRLSLVNNPLNPELAGACEEGFDAVMHYLRMKAEGSSVLNDAKLILIGEGDVGKSCLLAALRGEPWVGDRPTTHGIEIKPVRVTVPETGAEITLNGWDFGGQKVYRPTHQLFFSAPAVYLVVWKPREGPQQGFVKEWIKLVKHREPDAKIFVVATHGGPGQRQPDIDRQEIWDLFGRETVLDFFLVDSKMDAQTGGSPEIEELKQAIARTAASLPGAGRTVSARWQEAHVALKRTNAAYLPLARVIKICREHRMDEEDARLFLGVSHRRGHLIHYEHDPTLRDVVILKPDWLATAISLVLDDRQTRDHHGLVSFSRLSRLWNDPDREPQFHYPTELHPVFVRLMERFDLSYEVAGMNGKNHAGSTSLIAQLVPDVRPNLADKWAATVEADNEQQMQICRITDARTGQSEAAEGLFYQLIVRLHKYSLGRVDYKESVHWQRGLLLDDDYNGRALLEAVGHDIRITVRAAYPQGFLSVLTREVKWLVESFWAGLRCEVMVPCISPCGKGAPGTGLFEVGKLIESKRARRPEYPCQVCNEWQNIDRLLLNAPAAQREPTEELLTSLSEVRSELSEVRQQLIAHKDEVMGRFDHVDNSTQRILSQVDESFVRLMLSLCHEAREGPRLFSFVPVNPGFMDRPTWVNQKFLLTLWCEHSRLPLPQLNGKGDRRGIYELNLPRKWFTKAAPFFRVITSTLSLVLPMASSATRLMMDEAAYKGVTDELEAGQKSLDSVLQAGSWLGQDNVPDLDRGESIQAQGAILRQLHAMLKEKDPGFGGLVRVQNKRQEFLWVHPRFEGEY